MEPPIHNTYNPWEPFINWKFPSTDVFLNTSMWDIVGSKKFNEAKMKLPIALGMTTSNKVLVIDLERTPHLLITKPGTQAETTLINVIITSLLYKKHPNELKLVLISSKEKEFEVYAPIAKYYMAVLECNTDYPIITDVELATMTIKGLCQLMDQRYDILIHTSTSTVREYNRKIINGSLNHNEGYFYMPYIVVVIDDFVDFIMECDNDFETPLTRLAQLARAIGIHFVIATEHPTSNVITERVRLLFPGRIVFNSVPQTMKQIISAQVEESQALGKDDFIYQRGVEITKAQCPIIRTDPIRAVSNFISKQDGPKKTYTIPYA